MTRNARASQNGFSGRTNLKGLDTISDGRHSPRPFAGNHHSDIEQQENSADMYDDEDVSDDDDAYEPKKKGRSKKTSRNTPKSRRSAASTKSKVEADERTRETLDTLQKEYDKANNALLRFHKNARKMLSLQLEEGLQQANINSQLQVDLINYQKARIPDAETDDVVRSEFFAIMRKVRNWSEKWATPGDVRDVMKSPYDALSDFLMKTDVPVTSSEGLQFATEGSMSISVLLHSALAHYLAVELFTDRFFLCDEHPRGSTEPSIRTALWQVYNIGRQVNESKASEWLAQTMALIHPKELERYDFMVLENEKGKETMDQLKAKRIGQVCDCFLSEIESSGLCSELKEGDEKMRRDELLKIMAAAANLTLKLGVQRHSINALSYKDFEEMKFRADNNLMVLHPSMAANTDDSRCQNQPIVLVIEPAIIAEGNRSNSGYDQQKVWSKAMVWFPIPPREDSQATPKKRKAQTEDDETRNAKRDCKEDPCKASSATVFTKEGKTDNNCIYSKSLPTTAVTDQLQSADDRTREEPKEVIHVIE